MVCKTDTRMYTGSGINCPTSSGFAVVCVALHRGARSRGYKLSREGANPRSLVSGGGGVVSIEVGSSYCCQIV
jgi:hypothetical protein